MHDRLEHAERRTDPSMSSADDILIAFVTEDMLKAIVTP